MIRFTSFIQSIYHLFPFAAIKALLMKCVFVTEHHKAYGPPILSGFLAFSMFGAINWYDDRDLREELNAIEHREDHKYPRKK